MTAPLAIIILCRNEAANIGRFLRELPRQTLFAEQRAITVLVVANGCTDDTAAIARAAAPAVEAAGARLEVVDLPQGGKSRSWNRAVHEFAPAEADILLFLDGDIRFTDDKVLADVVARLAADPAVHASVGYPVKHQADPTARRTLADRFSLLVSRETRHRNAVNGSLYAIRADVARAIWLPDETPGEDGFLNAMVQTEGFRHAEPQRRVVEADRPTHYFEGVSGDAFIAHEARMIVGTMINILIFERLHALRDGTHQGARIAAWNREDPHWVQKLLDKEFGGRSWVVRRSLLLRRFEGWRLRPARLPVAAAATLLSLPAAFRANRRLRRAGAAGHW